MSKVNIEIRQPTTQFGYVTWTIADVDSDEAAGITTAALAQLQKAAPTTARDLAPSGGSGPSTRSSSGGHGGKTFAPPPTARVVSVNGDESTVTFELGHNPKVKKDKNDNDYCQIFFMLDDKKYSAFLKGEKAHTAERMLIKGKTITMTGKPVMKGGYCNFNNAAIAELENVTAVQHEAEPTANWNNEEEDSDQLPF